MSLSQNPNKAQPRIQEFDVLRAIAIILLIAHHGGIYEYTLFGYPLAELTHLVAGYLLGIFFFVSGYLMVGTLVKRSLSDFARSRLLRIYVPYWVALFLFLILMGVPLENWRHDLWSHLLGTQILLAPRFSTPILTLWFVSLILLYYLIFAVLLKLTRTKVQFLLAGGAVFLFAAFIRRYVGILEYRFFWYYAIFFAGTLCAQFNCLEKLASPRFWHLDKALLLAGSVVLLYPYRHLSAYTINLLEIFLYDFYVLAAILFSYSLARAVLARRPVPKLIQQLAYASFFAYLLHRPLWDVMLWIYTPPAPYVVAYLILAGAVLVFFLSYWGQKLYDQKLVQLQQSRPARS